MSDYYIKAFKTGTYPAVIVCLKSKDLKEEMTHFPTEGCYILLVSSSFEELCGYKRHSGETFGLGLDIRAYQIFLRQTESSC